MGPQRVFTGEKGSQQYVLGTSGKDKKMAKSYHHDCFVKLISAGSECKLKARNEMHFQERRA